MIKNLFLEDYFWVFLFWNLIWYKWLWNSAIENLYFFLMAKKIFSYVFIYINFCDLIIKIRIIYTKYKNVIYFFWKENENIYIRLKWFYKIICEMNFNISF